MRKSFQSFTVALIAVAAAFNFFAYEINGFNASLRVFLTKGKWHIRVFDDRGLPISRSARMEKDFVSPFYVVHYGLFYSGSCFKPDWTERYHWLEDPTAAYWNVPPIIATKKRFQYAADWVVKNLKTDAMGNAHLYYNFDWAYKNVPGGKVAAPWWSGLTEGHALTLLLRASDCFDDPAYDAAASDLYKSVLTPVSEGGSLLTMNGYPWIEEYVDPNLSEHSLSRVFNGMVYAYHGIRAYEIARGGRNMADALEEAIIKNVSEFSLSDHWSYYDAIGTSANIKYHRINLALIEDDRLRQSPELKNIVDDWRLGVRHSGFFYVLFGENSISKLHFILAFVLTVTLCFGCIRGVLVQIRKVK